MILFISLFYFFPLSEALNNKPWVQGASENWHQINVSPSLPRVGDGWGTNIHWTKETRPGEAKMLSEAFRVVRMDFKWSTVEKNCGKYNFSKYDNLLTTMQTYNLRPYWILDYGNECYPPKHKPIIPFVASSCSTETCIIAFARFAAAAAARYKDNNIIFECLNEPNGMGSDNATDITKLCLAASKQIRVQPLTTFVGPTTSGFPWNYLNTTIHNGILQAFDAVSVHPYRGSSPETVLSDYKQLREMMAAAALSSVIPPIYSGEWGYTTATFPCLYPDRCDETTQAAYLSRTWLINVLANVSVSIDYDWVDGTGSKYQCEARFGSVRTEIGINNQSFATKPKYIAAKRIQNTLGNYQEVRKRIDVIAVRGNRPPKLNDVFVLPFYNDSNTSVGFAVWSNGTSVGGKCATNSSTVLIKNRVDCGYSGISRELCLSPNNSKREDNYNCCWEENVKHIGGPECYSVNIRAPANATVSFRVPWEESFLLNRSCWSRVELLPSDDDDDDDDEEEEKNTEIICADSHGILNVSLYPLKTERSSVDAPVYLMPVR